MRKAIITSSIFLFFILGLFLIILSTIGFETNRFNNFISNKITKSNNDISVKLENIKFKFDIRNL